MISYIYKWNKEEKCKIIRILYFDSYNFMSFRIVYWFYFIWDNSNIISQVMVEEFEFL